MDRANDRNQQQDSVAGQLLAAKHGHIAHCDDRRKRKICSGPAGRATYSIPKGWTSRPSTAAVHFFGLRYMAVDSILHPQIGSYSILCRFNIMRAKSFHCSSGTQTASTFSQAHPERHRHAPRGKEKVNTERPLVHLTMKPERASNRIA